MPLETQDSIFEWSEQTFGEGRKLTVMVARTNTEMAELLQETVSYGNGRPGKLESECADVLVMLYTIASIAGFDLHEALNKKMAVNRARKWKLNGDGTAQHE